MMNEHKCIRDSVSNAVVNTDLNALQKYKLDRDRKNQETQTLQNCVEDINILKNDIKEIKNLLLKISEN